MVTNYASKAPSLRRPKTAPRANGGGPALRNEAQTFSAVVEGRRAGFTRHDRERALRQRQVLVLRIDCVPAAGLVPLRDGRGLLHLLDDLPEADAGVVRAERDFPHLRTVRNDAH